MPGSGKSTVGVILAKAVNCAFVDTDLVIQQMTGRLLQDIIDKDVDSLRFYYLGDKYKNKVEHIGAKPGFDVTDTLIF